jgi:hypothetical protein
MVLALLPLIAWFGPGAPTPMPEPVPPEASIQVDRAFNGAITKVEGMVYDQQVNALARKHGLSVVNVTWEDTGRFKGSSVGPNISDMTIGVRDPSGALHPMPVLRFDNFNDKTADLKTEELFVLTGNEDGRELRPTSLVDLLADTRSYLHSPRSWKGSKESLSAARDSHVLVSAQAAFLPIPREGHATFTPVIYNYQSSVGNPAVLTIVATREGTSIQVVENDAGYMSEVLYFNADGQRAPFTATRLSDFKASGGDATTPAHRATEDAGLNTVLVVQVPLKHRTLQRFPNAGMLDDYDMAPMAAAAEMSTRSAGSDVEAAVIGHGPVEGPFTEIHDLAIERDERFPVRVTVQFYKATSNGVVTDADVREVRKQIDQVYDQGDYVGSLVTAGYTTRPTEWTPTPTENATWARPWWSWAKAQ